MPKVTLEAARVNAGLSQKELADILGVTNITISSWERGKTEPSFSQLKKISELSGFPIDCLEICKKREE